MAKVYESIDSALEEWIKKQKMFFVATAPLSLEGHVNCSPKGLDTFRILNGKSCVYQDLTGSGIETIAHIQENKRITIMFCSFEGPPKIIRIYGLASVVTSIHQDFNKYADLFAERLGTRAYIVIQISRIADSCGYSIPLMEFKSDRNVLEKWTENKGPNDLIEYRKQKNQLSIDGLPGIQ